MAEAFRIVVGPEGRSQLRPSEFVQLTPEQLAGTLIGQRRDLLAFTEVVYQLTTDPDMLMRSNGAAIVPLTYQWEQEAAESNIIPVYATADTGVLVDAEGNFIALPGSAYPEAANYSALPGSAADGATYVVLTAQGIPFINRKDSGIYRYSGGSWVYLGAVPEGYYTDNILSFFDDGDASKQAKFQLSGISTGTTRTLSWPDKNGTIACLDDIVGGDHGGLTGLGDDDHTQYHNDARGDARYTLLGHTGAGGAAHSAAVPSGSSGFMTGADKAKLDAIPAGSTTQVLFNDGGVVGADAEFVYDKTTNTVTFGGITGSALAMLITPKAPTVLENPGGLFIRSQDATKANTAGGSLLIQTGRGAGTGADGILSITVGFSGVGLSMSREGMSFTGRGGEVFNSVNNNWYFQGPPAPVADFPMQFVAGLNTAATGCTPIEFSTDSGIMLTIGETTFGVQEFAAFGAALNVRPDTGIAPSTFVAGAGVAVNDQSTFDGYTIKQVVAALRRLGWLT